MNEFAELRACEEELADEPAELLWRQVHPRYFQEGVVLAEGFVGPKPDTSQISIVRQASRTSEEAEDYHRRTLGLETAGTWAVSVGEVQGAEGRCIDDASCDDVTTPGHAYIDLRHLNRTQRKVARVVLATAATNRGSFSQAA